MNYRFFSDEAIDWLCALIEIPRTSRNEHEAADMWQRVMTETTHGVVFRQGNNLWITAKEYDTTKPTLLLNAHLDTVKPVDAWTLPPHKATRKDGRIYGLGSNDDGASLVSLWQTFRILSQSEQPYNLIYLASAEEEVSGKNGIESVLPMLPHIDVALVGEPTGMQPAIAEKGLMVLDVTEKGKAGHAARNEGDNAIYHAMEDIHWFRTHQWEKQTELLGPVKMTVTIINAGTQHNVIPDTCTFTVDIRSNECYQNEELYRLICPFIKGEVKARSFRLNSSHISPEHPLIQKCISLGRAPFGSPTLSDQALMPFPSFKMGPGNSARSHTANEFIEEAEIHEAIPMYVSLLDQLDIQPKKQD